MNVDTSCVNLSTKGSTDIIDITDSVQANLDKSGLREGNVTIFVSGSTGGLTTVEYEPGLIKDLNWFFETILPSDKQYCHDATWHDGNGYAHLRSSLLKTSLVVPFSNGKLFLGTWQQIIFIDFDNRPRKRSIVTQFIGV